MSKPISGLPIAAGWLIGCLAVAFGAAWHAYNRQSILLALLALILLIAAFVAPLRILDSFNPLPSSRLVLQHGLDGLGSGPCFLDTADDLF